MLKIVVILLTLVVLLVQVNAKTCPNCRFKVCFYQTCYRGCMPGYSGQMCEERCSDKFCEYCHHRNATDCGKCVRGYFKDEETGLCTSKCGRWCKKCVKLEQTLTKLPQRSNVTRLTQTPMPQSNYPEYRCEKCFTGWYGKRCELKCSEGCINGICDRKTGRCICKGHHSREKCKDCGSEWYGESCSTRCSNGCLSGTCNSETGACNCSFGFVGERCDECRDGFYGNYCDMECSKGCKPGTCDRTTGRCKCLPGFFGESCNTCQPNFYGQNCSRSCSVGCIGGICDAKDGSCQCLLNFTGALCEDCIRGKYGRTCEKDCSEGCELGSCDRENGHCTCISGYTGRTCEPCEIGRFGDECLSECPKNCLNGSCNTVDGSCTCKLGFTGSQCDVCIPGRFGVDCDYNCAPECENGDCSPVDGACQCKLNFKGATCNDCVRGRFGNDCEKRCSYGCVNETCERSDGTCTCKEGYGGDLCRPCEAGTYGIDCQFQCSNGCRYKMCGPDGRCLCKDGFSGPRCEDCSEGLYGDKCQHDCSPGCRFGNCSRNDGYCECLEGFAGDFCRDCEDGRFGVQCEKYCSIGCESSQCGRYNGYCDCGANFTGKTCEECKPGRYGSSCNFPCSSGCQKGTCDKTTGTCSCMENFIGYICDACVDGKYGANCENNCSENCRSSNCGRWTGSCACKSGFSGIQCEDCIKGMFGESCDIGCGRGCQKGACDRNGSCVCVEAFSGEFCDYCLDGLYGFDCDKSCSIGCLNGSCQRQNGSCQCFGNFIGDTCESCAEGSYGVECSSVCSIGCENNTCEQSDGSCACRDNFQGAMCEGCIDGRYGELCDDTCSIGCTSGSCDRSNGSCYCRTGFSGDRCDRCEHGKFGENCNHSCSVGCLGGICERDTGFCDCLDGFAGPDCQFCSAGLYGSDCQNKCSFGCLNDTCNEADGHCSCKPGFVGDKCDRCLVGRYGKYCDLDCSIGCLGLNCSRIDGSCPCINNYDGDTCNRCMIGYYGKFCSKPCPHSCKYERCARYDRSCSYGCVNEYFKGEHCGECVEGKFGQLCELPCPANCKYRTCNRDTGDCDDCIGNFDGLWCDVCKPGYYGNDCRLRCWLCNDDSCLREGSECRDMCQPGEEDPRCTLRRQSKGFNIWVVAVPAGVIVSIVACAFAVILCHQRRRRDKRTIKKNRVIVQRPTAHHDYDNAWVASDSVDGSYNTMSFQPKGRGSCQMSTTESFRKPTLTRIIPESHIGTSLAQAEPDQYTVFRPLPMILDVYEFPAFVARRSSIDYRAEFDSLPRVLLHPYHVSQLPHNVLMNRYKGVYPYDHSRVTIAGDPNFYINANFIDGYKHEKEYIACIGPTQKTTKNFRTFWEMVWHHKVDKIVMLTNLVESGIDKCEQYWPYINTSQWYGDVSVTSVRENVFIEYTHRMLKLAMDQESRILNHLHFTVWPDKSVPEDPISLLDFINQVNNTPSILGGPVVVHCSAGVGRTGTYIAIDYLSRESHTGSVDVFGCLQTLRDQRAHMVQTAGQYEFLHKSLVHAINSDIGFLDTDFFFREPAKPDVYFDKIFQILDSTPDDLKEEMARETNIFYVDKNRRDADIPGDKWRPKLMLHHGKQDAEYINAVFLNGYRDVNKYIMAQSPLPNTVEEFLALLFQTDVSCIISLDDSLTQRTVYLPDEGQMLQYGVYTTSSHLVYSDDIYIERVINVKRDDMSTSGEMKIRHIRYKRWRENDDIPDSPREFIQMVRRVSKIIESYPPQQSVLVHCLDGAQRSGLFCAVSLLLEKLETDGQANLLNTLKRIRQRRKLAFDNPEQIKFVYECLVTSMEPEVDKPRNMAYSDFPGHNDVTL